VSRQTPQFSGAHKHRILFTTEYRKPGKDVFVGEISGQSTGTVYGGKAHGITKGSKFKLFDTSANHVYIGEATATEILSLQANLKINLTLRFCESIFKCYCQLLRDDRNAATAYCRVQPGDRKQSLKHKMTHKFWLQRVLRRTPFTESEKDIDADVIITVTYDDRFDGAKVSLSFGRSGGKDHLFMDDIGNQIHESFSNNDVPGIRTALLAMAQWRDFLRLRSGLALTSGIAVDLFELSKFTERDGPFSFESWKPQKKLDHTTDSDKHTIVVDVPVTKRE
jgi:hypothetical protein